MSEPQRRAKKRWNYAELHSKGTWIEKTDEDDIEDDQEASLTQGTTNQAQGERSTLNQLLLNQLDEIQAQDQSLVQKHQSNQSLTQDQEQSLAQNHQSNENLTQDQRQSPSQFQLRRSLIQDQVENLTQAHSDEDLTLDQGASLTYQDQPNIHQPDEIMADLTKFTAEESTISEDIDDFLEENLIKEIGTNINDHDNVCI